MLAFRVAAVFILPSVSCSDKKYNLEVLNDEMNKLLVDDSNKGKYSHLLQKFHSNQDGFFNNLRIKDTKEFFFWLTGSTSPSDFADAKNTENIHDFIRNIKNPSKIPELACDFLNCYLDFFSPQQLKEYPQKCRKLYFQRMLGGNPAMREETIGGIHVSWAEQHSGDVAAVMEAMLERGRIPVRWLPEDTFKKLVSNQTIFNEHFCKPFSARHLEHLSRLQDAEKLRSISEECFAAMKDLDKVNLSRQLMLMGPGLFRYYNGSLTGKTLANSDKQLKRFAKSEKPSSRCSQLDLSLMDADKTYILTRGNVHRLAQSGQG